MGLFDFFRKDTDVVVRTVDADASAEQVTFVTAVLASIAPSITSFGFRLTKTEIKKYSSSVIFRKRRRYIKVSASNYPTDYPYCYNVTLGEGNSEKFYESDWNAVALWEVAQFMEPGTSISSYDFPWGSPDLEKKIKHSVGQAENHLLKYGKSFLQGNMQIFRAVRAKVNSEREPYRISTVGSDGARHITYDLESLKVKKKYS